jgi:hypothetical protein
VEGALKRLAGIALCGLFGGIASAADMSVYKAPVIPSWTPSWTAYTLFDAVSYTNTFPTHDFKAHVFQSTNGLTLNVTPNWTLGGGFIYTRAENDLYYLGPGAKSSSDGITGFGTTSYTIPNVFTVGAAGGYGVSKLEQSRFVLVAPGGPTVAALSTQDSQLWFVSGFISKILQYGNLYVTPTARVLYRENPLDSYFENAGSFGTIFNPALVSRLGEFSYGAQFAYAMPAGNGWTVYPTVELFGLHDFQLPLYQTDRDGLDLKAGISATVGSWSMGAYYMTILGIDAFHDFNGGRFFLTYKFGGESATPSGVPWGASSGGVAPTYTRPGSLFQ